MSREDGKILSKTVISDKQVLGVVEQIKTVEGWAQNNSWFEDRKNNYSLL